jgi:hypothetical protein
MILEVAIMKIKPDLISKFEAVFPKAAAVFTSTPGRTRAIYRNSGSTPAICGCAFRRGGERRAAHQRQGREKHGVHYEFMSLETRNQHFIAHKARLRCLRPETHVLGHGLLAAAVFLP